LRAFAVDSFGETGSIHELPTPEPGPGEARLRIAAAGVNPVDWKILKGYLKDFAEHRFPLIPGQEGSGVVDALGPGVEDLAVGDEVYGSPGLPFFGGGTFAEFAIVSPATVAPRPAGLNHAQAAALPVCTGTAIVAVETADLKAGDVVLVVGAAGGVGGFAVQLAAIRGAKVIAVTRGQNSDYVRGLGAMETVDYTSADVASAVRSAHPDGVDAIIDTVSDAGRLAALTTLLRPGGRVVSVVGAAPAEVAPGSGIKAVNIVGGATRERLSEVNRLLASGTLRLPEIRTLPLEDATTALAESEAGHVRGKLVLTVSPELT
jgi:NADPH:quinone reductase